MSGKWTWKYNEMGDLLRGPEIRTELVAKAEAVKAVAEVIAPVGDPVTDVHSGLYAASFGTEDGVMTNIEGNEVGYAKVVNHAPYAAAVEYGNGHFPPHHTMARALEIGGGA